MAWNKPVATMAAVETEEAEPEEEEVSLLFLSLFFFSRQKNSIFKGKGFVNSCFCVNVAHTLLNCIYIFAIGYLKPVP